MAARKKAAVTTKKATVKKTTTKKAVTKAAPIKKITAIKEKYTKTQLLNQIADNTELTRKQVQSVLDELTDLIEGHIKKRSVGEFSLPGLLKVTTVKKPAKKARKGINPFTGEEATFKAKPASVQVKIRPLKKLKEMAVS